MLVVHPSLPVTSVKELIALARARPDQIAWASTGTGSYTWLTMAQLLQMTGTKALDHPESTKILGAQALDPMHMTVDEFAARLKSDYGKYERLIRSTGAQAQ